jgi:hypothetical protein
MTVGQTVLIITRPNIIQDSVNVFLNQGLLDRDDDTQVSYSLSYGTGNVTITFNQAVSASQVYIITYAYAN